jgi:3-dehydroquinate synthase
MISEFKIQEQILSAESEPEVSASLLIVSSPRAYQVEFLSGEGAGQRLAAILEEDHSAILLIDKKIKNLYLQDADILTRIPTHVVEATEEAKEIQTVLNIVDFLESEQATKTSMLYVVGGGILQDLGAFAGAMYKRGLPWTFIPTTLLAQSDSSVGGKTALNHKRTKNLLALFSAPRRVIIDTGFLATLPQKDILSGAGEILRLCITGGKSFLDVFAKELPAFLQGDTEATSRLIATSLSAKRAVVEFDEFELDLRRSMNYGHSFGHALEALTKFDIPHGVGVAIGILVENEIAYKRGMLPRQERDQIIALGRQIIPEQSLQIFSNTSLDGILDLLRRDKKTQGSVLKLATLEYIGQIRFIDFVLNAEGEAELGAAVRDVLAEIS